MKSLKAVWHWLITSEQGNECPLVNILSFPAVLAFVLVVLPFILMCLPVFLAIVFIQHKIEQRQMRGFVLARLIDKEGNEYEQGKRP